MTAKYVSMLSQRLQQAFHLYLAPQVLYLYTSRVAQATLKLMLWHLDTLLKENVDWKN